ncbi:cytochrome P450 [Trametes cingulata]|nr:cytochrome P450 [Trametes cingulata]
MLLHVVLFSTAWLLWRVMRATRARSPLDKVPGPPPASFLTGNLGQIMDKRGWSFHTEIAEKYGSVIKLHWLFGKPWLYVFDPLALQHVLKDTATYDELPWYVQSNRMMLGPGVLSVTGETHRKQRRMLTPVFSPRHLRDLVPVFYRVTHKLVDAVSSRVQGDVQDIDVLSWMSRAALELIGQSGIGYSFDPLTEDVADSYAEAVENFVPVATSSEMMLLRQATPLHKYFGPSWLRRWLVEKLPIPTVQKMIHISDTLHQRSLEIFQAKKAAILAGEKTDSKDIITILLKANMAASEEERLPDDQLLGQMSSIIFAAMDTTSSALSRTLNLLAENPDVQDKLRREIIEAKNGCEGELSYDQLHALPYLEAVCRETLRLYAPAPQTFRGTMKDAVLPLSEPIHATDGTVLRELVVPRGTNIFVGIMACNRNKALWGEDAYEWKPERWLKPLPEAIEKASVPGVYAHMMTFLGGIRSCIGFRFSQLEMKVVLAELLTHFSFELSEKPIVWNLSGIAYPSTSEESSKPELWLKVRKLSTD